MEDAVERWEEQQLQKSGGWPAGIRQTGSGVSPSQTGGVPEGGQEKEPGASPVPCASGTKNSRLERSQDPDRGGQEEKERRQNVPQKRKSSPDDRKWGNKEKRREKREESPMGTPSGVAEWIHSQG